MISTKATLGRDELTGGIVETIEVPFIKREVVFGGY